jgi:adenylate cyclase class 2
VYEVELKFRVEDPQRLERSLVALAARFHDPLEQVDRYFSHPCRDFGRTDEALRLRRVGESVAVTWKGPRIDAAAKTRQELELAVANVSAGASAGVTIDRWTELLEALGFRQVREVAKRRRPARVPWQGSDVDVALDRIEGLGEFVELELLARPGEIPLATACLQSLASELGCGLAERRSYLELLLAAEPVAH